MTGGQMAPTTMIGQKATTCQQGRSVELNGYPIHVSEMLAQLQGPCYIERVSTHDVKHVKQAEKAIDKAFRNQAEGKGFSLVEVLSSCPTNWGKSPLDAMKWVEEEMCKILGLFIAIKVSGTAMIGDAIGLLSTQTLQFAVPPRISGP